MWGWENLHNKTEWQSLMVMGWWRNVPSVVMNHVGFLCWMYCWRNGSDVLALSCEVIFIRLCITVYALDLYSKAQFLWVTGESFFYPPELESKICLYLWRCPLTGTAPQGGDHSRNFSTACTSGTLIPESTTSLSNIHPLLWFFSLVSSPLNPLPR